MNRDFVEQLYQYFEQKENRTPDEDDIFSQLKGELPYFKVTSVCREDLESRGFDTSKVDDSDMETLASKLSDDYCEQMYWISLDIIAEEGLEIPKYMCPKCGEDASECDNNSKCTCGSCDNEWTKTEPTGQYVLVESPEETSFFDEHEVGYDCYNSDDDSARYVPEHFYKAYFEEDPKPSKLMVLVHYPESQQYLELEHSSPSEFKQCELIQGSKQIKECGENAIWVPLSIIKNVEENETRI